jgi:hypothetical protein
MTINTRKVFKIYRSLDAEQIRFVIEKAVEGSYSVTEWLAHLRKIAIMDAIGDDTRQNSGNLTIIFGLFMLFTLVLTISKPFLFFFPIAFFLLFFYFLFNYIQLSRIDIRNNLRIFVVPLIEYFEDEELVEGNIFLRMDFSNPIKKDKLISSRDKDSKTYKIHWMDGEMILKDGVKIVWEIEDVIKKVERNIQALAHKIDLTSKIYMDLTGNIKNILFIDHDLKVRFFAPKSKFEPLDEDIHVTEDNEYYILSKESKDKSDSMDEGMDPKVFIKNMEACYQKFKKIIK